MANGVFNIAKGRVVELYNRVKSNDPATSAFVVVLLETTGLDADDTLNNFDDLATLLAANPEADFTGYARKVLSDADLAALPAPDDTNNWRDLDVADQTWVTAGPGDGVSKLLICYDLDTTGGTDSTIVPCTYHDFVFTPDGTDVTAVVAAAGFYRAA